MKVQFFDTTSKLPLGNATPVGSMDELVRTSDVITIHVPDTDTTRSMFASDQIAKMKPGSYLLNNARGSIVDLNAMRDAIKSGQLAGAAVDVFPDEPAKSGESFSSPLQGLDNVILTPHVGGSTIEAQEAIALDIANKLTRYMNLGTTTGAVNVPEVDLPDQHRTDDARSHRILNFHKNVPGVLNKIHEAAADLDINISGQYLQTNAQIGYLVLDADPSNAAALHERINAIQESIRTRILW